MASSRYFAFKASFCRTTLAVALLGLLTGAAFAKEPELWAIEVYPISDSQAYVQIAGFVLNSKNEVHLCGARQSIDKNSYSKLPKITLAAGMSLERAQGGVLLLTRVGGQPECVVPANLKGLERRETETPAELAERTDIQGQIVSKSVKSTESIPPVTLGVKIVLVQSRDDELAEFLLAQRWGTIAAWKSYLAMYPTGPHINEARSSLAALYVQDGKTALGAYQASLKGPKPDYEKLQAAKSSLGSALALVEKNTGTEDLRAGIHHEAQILNYNGLDEIKQYQNALAKQVSGFHYLISAEAILEITSRLDPNSLETISLNKADTKEKHSLDQRFADFDTNLSVSRPEEAYEAIKQLRPFAEENPKVQDRLDRLYTYYVDAGKKDETKRDPQDQVTEYQKALEVEPRPEMAEMLKTAQKQAQENTDEAAVTTALHMSSGLEEDKDYVAAYEVLIDLTPAQRKQAAVADRLEALKELFLQKAPPVARELQKNNTPPQGLPNEIALQRAYFLMDHCHDLNSDPDLNDRVLTLGHSLSDYYLERAKKYLNRQDGTGGNLGWKYLDEALEYKVADKNAVRDEIKTIANGHQSRSRPSISIKFSDPTSTPDGGDFPERITRSLAAALESSKPKVEVVGPTETTAPNFAIVGNVQIVKSPKKESLTKTSKYRSSEPVASAEWTAANQEYSSANRTWETAQKRLQAAEYKGKKKLIADANQQVAEAQKKVDEAQAKRDSILQTRPGENEHTYTYIEQINHLNITVEVHFNIQDGTGKAISTPAPISVTEEKPIITLEGVKPGDTTVEPAGGGVVTEAQFLDQVESEASDALLKEAKECVDGLPTLILKSADQKASGADIDGAAEFYMLYLDSTEKQATPDWKRAQKFLFDHFNFRAYGDTPQA